MNSNAKSPETLTKNHQEPAKEDVLICRCQEVTESEIVAAIRDGATTVGGRLIQRIIARETGINPAEIIPQKSRMPVRPVKIGSFESEGDHE